MLAAGIMKKIWEMEGRMLSVNKALQLTITTEVMKTTLSNITDYILIKTFPLTPLDDEYG